MRSAVAILCLALTVSGCSKDPDPPAAPDDRAAAPESSPESPAAPRVARESDYDRMIAVLELTAQDKARLKQAFDAADAALAEWDAANGDRLRNLEADMKAAVKNRRLTELRSITEEAAPLRRELSDLVAEHKYKTLMALPPDQRAGWNAQRLSQRLIAFMEPLDLTHEDIDAIRAKALEIAREIDWPAPDPNPLPAAYLALEGAVENQVLTPDQRPEFDAVKQRKKIRSLGW